MGITSSRHIFTLINGKVFQDGKECRITFQEGKIQVGCSDLTPEVLSTILGEYHNFMQGPRIKILQEG